MTKIRRFARESGQPVEGLGLVLGLRRGLGRAVRLQCFFALYQSQEQARLSFRVSRQTSGKKKPAQGRRIMTKIFDARDRRL
ncbi:MAG: hypothetical protein C9356_05745 [Oleiphilus sp.]|nr:MAG: hypothetical protein C9356_05745 [Oleiphilus sp.]